MNDARIYYYNEITGDVRYETMSIGLDELLELAEPGVNEVILNTVWSPKNISCSHTE